MKTHTENNDKEIEKILWTYFSGHFNFYNNSASKSYYNRAEEATAQIQSLLNDRIIEATNDYILVTLGWMEANKENLSVDEIIATLKAQTVREDK